MNINVLMRDVSLSQEFVRVIRVIRVIIRMNINRVIRVIRVIIRMKGLLGLLG